MERTANIGQLATKDWDQLQEWADRFEEACRKEWPVDLNRYLPTADHPLRRAALQEFVKLVLEFHGRKGEPVRLANYIERFPELGTSKTVSPHLVYEEYRVRQLHGDRADLASYETTYPSQFEELKRL